MSRSYDLIIHKHESDAPSRSLLISVHPLECKHDPSGQELKMPLQIQLKCCFLQEVFTDCYSTLIPSPHSCHSLVPQVLRVWHYCS